MLDSFTFTDASELLEEKKFLVCRQWISYQIVKQFFIVILNVKQTLVKIIYLNKFTKM